MIDAASTSDARTANQIWHQLKTIDFRLLEELRFLSVRQSQTSPTRAHYCKPGRAYLARKLGCTITTVSRHTSRLKALGVIQKLQRRPHRGRFRSCLYAIVAPAAWRITRLRHLIERTAHRVTFRARKAAPPETAKAPRRNEAEYRALIAKWMARGRADN